MNPAAVRLCSAEELNLEKTLTCGQCFRWEKENTAWIGIAGAVPARLWEENGSVWLQSPDPGPWRDYFDLATDYRTLAHRIEDDAGFSIIKGVPDLLEGFPEAGPYPHSSYDDSFHYLDYQICEKTECTLRRSSFRGAIRPAFSAL